MEPEDDFLDSVFMEELDYDSIPAELLAQFETKPEIEEVNFWANTEFADDL